MSDDLLERLDRGVLHSGLHDDNETELFEVDDANDTMAEAKAEIEKLRDLLSRNIDADPCRLDHHGYCQTHYLEEDCSVAAARAALGETK